MGPASCWRRCRGWRFVPFTGHPLLRVASLGQGRAWLLLAATVALTCLVTLAVPVRAKTGRELLLSGVDGLLMEVPMRWATLPCLWALLSWREMTAAGPIAVVVTAAVWCGRHCGAGGCHPHAAAALACD